MSGTYVSTDEVRSRDETSKADAKARRPIDVELTASPATVRAGQPVRLKAKAMNIHWWDPHSFCFFTDAGRIIREGGVRGVRVDTTGLEPGIYRVKVHLVLALISTDHATGHATFEVI